MASTSSSTSSTSIRGRKATVYMYLVEGFRRRTSMVTSQTTHGAIVREFLKGCVIVKGGGTAVYNVFVNDLGNREEGEIKKVLGMDAMAKDRYFGIRDCVVDEVNLKISVSLKSQIYLTGAPFAIPRDVVEEYRHPVVVSIKDLNRSPVKRRASVRGVVSEVGEVRTVRGEKRLRNIKLQEGDDTISISLWEEHTMVAVSVDQRVQVAPVVVSEFNNKKYLESTSTMKLQTVIDNTEFEGELMAVSDDEYKIPYEIIVLEDEQERVLTVDQKSSLVGMDLSMLPCSVKVVVESEGLKEVVVRLEKILD